MKITFIDDIKKAWRFAVMWVQAFGLSLMTAWIMLTDEQKQAVLGLFGITADNLLAFTAISIMLSTAFARVIKQPALEDKQER